MLPCSKECYKGQLKKQYYYCHDYGYDCDHCYVYGDCCYSCCCYHYYYCQWYYKTETFLVNKVKCLSIWRQLVAVVEY